MLWKLSCMHNSVPTLGWDVGGAHLKAVLVGAEGHVSQVFQQPCPLWRGLDRLDSAVDSIMSEVAATRLQHVVTMTGELADIFPGRETGVVCLAQTMSARLGDPGLRFYSGRSGMVSLDDVPAHAADIASANWHASAACLAMQVKNALFVDIGSTTADLIPLHQGIPSPRGYTDAERLRFEELVYTGVVRTPVMAVAQRVPFDGEWQGLAAEHFATMADVYRLTGDLPEGYDMAETADGAVKTPEASARRLARMVGRDLPDAAMTQWRRLAHAIKSSQLALLRSAAERALSRGLLDDDAPMIGAGAGSFLVREMAMTMGRTYVEAASLVSAPAQSAEWAGVCFPAFSVAWLARER
jgi:probable H4MPT-linked C1 transfer pathway protein